MSAASCRVLALWCCWSLCSSMYMLLTFLAEGLNDTHQRYFIFLFLFGGGRHACAALSVRILLSLTVMWHVVNVVFKCLEFDLGKLPVFHLINFIPPNLWCWLAVCCLATGVIQSIIISSHKRQSSSWLNCLLAIKLRRRLSFSSKHILSMYSKALFKHVKHLKIHYNIKKAR